MYKIYNCLSILRGLKIGVREHVIEMKLYALLNRSLLKVKTSHEKTYKGGKT